MASPYALDFSPVANALSEAKQFDLARNKLAMEQQRVGFEGERLGFERELQPYKVSQAKQAVDTGQLEYEGNLAKRFGGMGQAILTEQDPAKKAAYLRQIAAHPQMKAMFDKALPPGWQSNPDLVGHFTATIAQGYQDPEHQRLLQAQARQAEAEANKAGYVNLAPGTNLISIAPQRAGAVAAAGQGAGAQRQALPASPTTADVASRMGQPEPQPQGTPSPGTVVASSPLKPPPGYELDPTKPGSGEYRPQVGGPADIKFTEAKNKALFSVQSSGAKIDDLIQNITELETHPGLKGNFGLTGILPNFPGTQSSDAFAKLQQLKSQGGFAMLQAMRDASKTGGALGNVSDAEGARLEAAFGALQRTSSLPQALQEMKKIKAQAIRSKGMLMEAFDRQYGAGTTPAQTPTRNAGGGSRAIGDMSLGDLRKLSPQSLTPEQKKAAADRWDALTKAPAGAQ